MLSIVEDTKENNVHTTIYTQSHYLDKMYFYIYSLIFISIDSIILTIILVIGNIKNKIIKSKYGIIIAILSNTIITFLFLPKMILFTLILNILIIIVFLLKYLYGRKLKRKNNILEKDDMENNNNNNGNGT